MKKLKLNIDYQRKAEDSKESAVETTVNLIFHAMNSQHKNGLSGQSLRTWGRLQRKLEDALEDDISILEIEDAEFDLIEKPIEEATYPLPWAKLVCVFQDNLFYDPITEK